MSSSDPTTVREAINRFSFELFKVFVSRHKNEYLNMCFSPAAIFNSLAMVLVGAGNETERQLSTVLRLRDLKSDKKRLEEMYKWQESIVKGNHDIILAIRYLYIDKSLHLKPEYKKLLKDYFEVKAKKVDFKNVEETVNIINNDSKESTDGVIDNIIDPKDISGDNQNAKLILTNSMFFRGFWSTSFEDVTKRKFKYGKNNERSVEIQMMRQLGYFRFMYFRQLKAHIVSIPYVNTDLRMIVILPEYATSDGHHIIQYLNRDLFDTIMNSLQSQEKKTLLDLTIPRFALDAQKMSVQRTIKQMGALDVFDESLADLSGMSDQKIFLTKLVHKAFILVDERGSGLSDSRHVRKQTVPVDFVADHPFVFIIAEKGSNIAIFMAFFADPTEMLEVVRESDLTPEEVNRLLASVQSV